MPTIAENIHQAAQILANVGIDNSRLEASSILSLAIGKDRTYIITNPAKLLTENEQIKFSEFLARRANREPLQHIRGKQEFYGLDFIVSPDVLIPRPETEMIVEFVIDKLKYFDKPHIAEVGTGSGCISISILANLQSAIAVAGDISTKALTIATENAIVNKVSERIEFINSDLLNSFPKMEFDVIVANLPYIPAIEIEGLQPEVKNFDPLIALTDGFDGLRLIDCLMATAISYLKNDGFIVLEFGIGQEIAISEKLNAYGYSNIKLFNDLSEIPRMITAQCSK